MENTEEAALAVRQDRRKFRVLWVVVLVIILGMAVFTYDFYQTQKARLFQERQSHLTEMTVKVSEVVNTTIDSVQQETYFAKELLEQEAAVSRDTLPSTVQSMAKTLGLEEGVLLALDSSGLCYCSDGRSWIWEHLEDLVSTEPTLKIRDMVYGGERQDCMLFFQCLDTPRPVGVGSVEVTHVAIAIPMDTMKETFSLSVFNGSCYTYLINNNGLRLYKQTYANHFIEQLNVLSVLENEQNVMGGTMDDLTQAVVQKENLCLEFENGEDGERYFVSTTPVTESEWTLLMFVPTKALDESLGSSDNIVLTYVSIIAVGVTIIFCCLIYLIMTGKHDREKIIQEQETNRALAAAAEEARQANASKTEFLSHMSHDIRTPINGIIGMTNIATKEIRNCQGQCPRVEDCLHKISGAADHLLSLINDVLDMSHIESGKIELAHASMELDTVLDNCVSIIGGQLVTRHVDFLQEFEKFEHPFLFGDELHLRRIFINILGNAVKFTPDGGTITFRAKELSAEDGKARYRFEVQDTGMGMSEEFQKKIFEPFTQEDGGARTTYKGSGLGMAITKQYVELMGGTIQVRSKLNEGSCFIVELAFEIDPEARLEVPEHITNGLKGMRVLLVEDNELNMEIAQELLEDEGVTVTTAENGQIAVDTFTNAPAGSFDAILMDVMMPVMNGHEATRTIRASNHPEAKTIPIIAMTANAYQEDVQAALQAGMDAHVAKPIETDLLFSVLNRYKRGGGE
jgi:signal transduction histidine kinase/CheY-like chemotaxis protein